MTRLLCPYCLRRKELAGVDTAESAEAWTPEEEGVPAVVARREHEVASIVVLELEVVAAVAWFHPMIGSQDAEVAVAAH